MLWQVTVPMLVGGLVFLALAVLACLAGARGGDVGRWAGISLIWLIVPLILATVIMLAILAGSIYALMQLIRVIPGYSYQALGWLLLLGLQLQRLNDRLVEPFMRMQMASAALRTLGRRGARK